MACSGNKTNTQRKKNVFLKYKPQQNATKNIRTIELKFTNWSERPKQIMSKDSQQNQIKKDEYVQPDTPNVITNRKTEKTETGVKQGIEKLKNRKSSGEGQINSEHLKYGENCLVLQTPI